MKSDGARRGRSPLGAQRRSKHRTRGSPTCAEDLLPLAADNLVAVAQRERVVVTVRREGDDVADGRDLKLPISVPAGELSRLVQAALGWAALPDQLCIRVEPGGRVLGPQESLARAGVWDGAWLVFTADAIAAEPVPIEADHWPSLLPAKS